MFRSLDLFYIEVAFDAWKFMSPLGNIVKLNLHFVPWVSCRLPSFRPHFINGHFHDRCQRVVTTTFLTACLRGLFLDFQLLEIWRFWKFNLHFGLILDFIFVLKKALFKIEEIEFIQLFKPIWVPCPYLFWKDTLRSLRNEDVFVHKRYLVPRRHLIRFTVLVFWRCIHIKQSCCAENWFLILSIKAWLRVLRFTFIVYLFILFLFLGLKFLL